MVDLDLQPVAEGTVGGGPDLECVLGGSQAARLSNSARALADDYVRLTEEVLERIAELETTTTTGVA